MNEIICPKCNSKNVQKQAYCAPRKLDDQPYSPVHIVPNECRECKYQWYNE